MKMMMMMMMIIIIIPDVIGSVQLSDILRTAHVLKDVLCL